MVRLGRKCGQEGDRRDVPNKRKAVAVQKKGKSRKRPAGHDEEEQNERERGYPCGFGCYLRFHKTNSQVGKERGYSKRQGENMSRPQPKLSPGSIHVDEVPLTSAPQNLERPLADSVEAALE